MIFKRGVFGGFSLTGKDKKWLQNHIENTDKNNHNIDIEKKLIVGRKILNHIKIVYSSNKL